MRWTYDATAGALYVYLRTGQPVQQVEMPDGVIVDLNASAQVVGIEVLSAGAGWDWLTIAEQFGLTEAEIGFIHQLATSPLVHMRTSQDEPASSLTRERTEAAGSAIHADVELLPA